MKTQRSGLLTRNQAFSLVELFVLAAICAALASLFFFSALHHAREQATEAGCLNNLRRLSLGWQMYASENRGVLPFNDDEGDQPQSVNPLTIDPQWCPGQMQGGTGSQPTNVAWIKAGQIYPYVGSPLYYRCPVDVSTYSGSTVYPLGGKGSPRVRSYSMNTWVGCPQTVVNATIGGEANYYRVFRQEADLASPGAANIFLLADENPYSINDPMLWEQPVGNAPLPTATSWVDYPAAWHGGGGGISFCDGHVQIRKWTDQTLLNLVSVPIQLPATPPRTDLLWLLAHTTAHK